MIEVWMVAVLPFCLGIGYGIVRSLAGLIRENAEAWYKRTPDTDCDR